MSYPPSEEELRLYSDVIHMHTLLNTDCPQTKDSFRSTLFALHTKQLLPDAMALSLFNYVWYDCNKSSVLVSMLVPFAGQIWRYIESSEIDPSHLARNQALRCYAQMDSEAAKRFVPEPIDVYPYEPAPSAEFEASDEQDKSTLPKAKLLPLPSLRPPATTASFILTSSLAPDSAPHLADMDVLYLRWPYIRRLFDSGLAESSTRTAELPISDAVILHILRHVYSPLEHPYEYGSRCYSREYMMSEEDAMEILSIGPEFNLYSTLVPNAELKSVSPDASAGIFAPLVQWAINLLQDPAPEKLLPVYRFVREFGNPSWIASYSPSNLTEVPLEDLYELLTYFPAHKEDVKPKTAPAPSQGSKLSDNGAKKTSIKTTPPTPATAATAAAKKRPPAKKGDCVVS